ncbi:MAG TPA: SCP2 sterol-binding domain-containing protein [Pseudonocardia sp.]|uniref:SCP2 sterol-binding domain-containing protein n=1 Tax=Pseudonocardia sp. TaxID=60912 RepID=UPI002B6EFD82|nr:SCP2 sterol-binding domain-containing protein [Pseudonocardia sp.]HTF55489.1 SCP2 sterol-binding domain-containing protein [Pseudonocardia sp.]
MAKMDSHPNVIEVRRRVAAGEVSAPPEVLDAGWLRELCHRAGADDVGFVEIERPELAEERPHLEAAFRRPRALISFVCTMNREAVRSPARSASNLEFHLTNHDTNEVARRIVAELESIGVRAFNGAVGFPMEMDRFPSERIWVVAHKPIAVEAGLGRMGIHRNVIHPKLGNFILLGTVVLDTPVSEYSRPLDYNPCLECKLCVAACPTGAINSDGRFDFSACYTHNYREFLGGFGDWVENVVEAKDAPDYRARVSEPETASVWQSLSFGPNYKAAYCVSVCPAGEDVLGPYLDSRKTHLAEVVKPLQNKPETIYVVAGSDAEAHVAHRFPHKRTKRVGNGLRARTVDAFMVGLPLIFQREVSRGLAATYHFTFTGAEQRAITIVIRDGELTIAEGHDGAADLRIRADTATWFGFLAGERGLLGALLRRRIRISGPPRLLRAFARCFPR